MKALVHTAKELLAASVLEIFPGTELLGGEVSEGWFSYSFRPIQGKISSFKDAELLRVEDQMRVIISEKRAINSLEMVPFSAKEFFIHHRQFALADLLSREKNQLVSLFKMGEFVDLCEGPFCEDTSFLSAFKLVECKWDGKQLSITGVVAADKEELKEFLKKYRDSKKKNVNEIGERLGLFAFDAALEAPIFLSKGEPLRFSLIEQWRKMHQEMGFEFAYTSGRVDLPALHALAYKKMSPKLPFRVATFREDEEGASIFCQEAELSKELISSLQFIEQTIKIFQLERRISLIHPKNGFIREYSLLKEALAEAKLPFEEELSNSAASIEYRLIDRAGRGGVGPHMTCDVGEKRIYRSLFGSLNRFVMLMVEKLSVGS